MMETEETRPFTSIFGEDVVQSLAPDVLERMSNAWKNFQVSLEEEKISKEREDVIKDHKFCDLERDLDLTRQQLETKMLENDSQVKEMQDVLQRFNDTRQKLSSVEDANNRLLIENQSLKREREQLSGERNDLFQLADRRQNEIENLHKDWQKVSEELREANNAKYEALLKAQDIDSKEVSLQFREKRIEEEKEYLSNQVSSLMSELKEKNAEIIAAKREQIVKLADLQADKAALGENVRIIEGKMEALKEDNETYQNQIMELGERLKTARNSELKMEENYRQELQAQTKLAELYKGHHDEFEKKSEEMAKAVTELQGLLKEAAERYGALEDHFEKEKGEHKEELKKRNDAIRGLKKELEDSNGLIKTLRNKGLTTEEIEKLSPSAAAASRLLKSGMTLTQIYSQLVTCQEELLNSKDENTRLNTYLDQILQEIEERAPILKQQREEYESAVHSVETLSRQLEEARQEYEFRNREAAECRQRTSTVTRENVRLTQQVQDLSKQVACLVREVEASRSSGLNLSMDRSRMDVSGSSADLNRTGDAESIINDRLLNFRDVSELQQRNIELLAVVRELSSNQELSETRLVEEKTGDLRGKLEEALEQVEELRGARQRQEVMVESIIVERDMLKTRLEAAAATVETSAKIPTLTPGRTSTPSTFQVSKSPSPAKNLASLHELEKRTIAAEAALAESQKEFDTYRQEKAENEKLMLEDLQTTRKELNESRVKAIKLGSQEEYNNERFKVAQTNAQTFRKQVKLLEERNAKLNGIVSKHEQTIDLLRTEVLQSQSKLSQVEIRLDTLIQENAIYKASEKRIVKENELLHRQKTSSALVLENLKLIKLNLEKSEEEKNMRLQNKVEDLENELSLVRKKLDSEQETNKEAVKAWESAQNDLKAQLEDAKTKESGTLGELESLKGQLEEIRGQLRDTQMKLEMAESANSAKGVQALTRQESQPEVSAKVRDLQLQLNQAKNEINNLKEQLLNSRNATAQYKDIADSAEKRLTESNDSAKALKGDLESRLTKALDDKKALEQQLEDLVKQREESAKTASIAELQQLAEKKSASLEQVTQQLQEAEARQAELQVDAEKQMNLAQEAQERYQRELVQHAQDVEHLNNMKTAMATHQNQVDELVQTKKAMEEALMEVKESSEEKVKMLKAENEKLQEQFSVVERENTVVHAQLVTVTQQMTSLQKNIEGHPDANKSFTEEESKSTEQLMQIVKYLRREKEILTSKMEVTQAEATRVKTQVEYLEKSLAETQASLNKEREKNATKAMSSSKYNELLQRVQNMSALSDSNKMLREDTLRLTDELARANASLKETEEKLKPLEEKMRLVEETESVLKVEAEAAKQECIRWKNRANQLVEKQQKINPDELKRIQDDNSTLTKQVSTLQAQVKQSQANSQGLNAKIKQLESNVEKAGMETKLKTGELNKAMAEVSKLKTTNQHTTSRLNAINAKSAELDAQLKQVNQVRDTLKTELDQEKVKLIEALKQSEKLESMKKTLESNKNTIETLTKQKEEKVTTNQKLRQLARQLKETSEARLKEIEDLKTKLQAAQEEAKSSALAVAAATSSGDGQDVTESSNLNQKLEDLKKELEDLKNEKDTADHLLEQAQAEIEDLGKHKDNGEKEISELKQELEAQNQKLERFKLVMSKIKEESSSGGASSTTVTKLSQEYEEKLNSLRAEKNSISETLESERKAMEEKVASLEQEILNLQKQLGDVAKPSSSGAEKSPSETVTASIKPMSGSAPVPRKQQAIQPQAHIQPTRHMPATATIRPHRGSTNVPVIRTASTASTTVDVPQITVPPTIVTVSRNPPVSTTVTPSAMALNPAAPDFVPSRGMGESESSSEATPRAMVLPQRDQVEIEPEAGPSTASSSASARSSVSVLPTPKRAREGEEETESTETKKARLLHSDAEDDDDVVIVSSSDENEGDDDELVGAEEEEEEEEEEVEDEALEEDIEAVDDDEVLIDDGDGESAAVEETTAMGEDQPPLVAPAGLVSVDESVDVQPVEEDTDNSAQVLGDQSEEIIFEDMEGVVPSSSGLATSKSASAVLDSAVVPTNPDIQQPQTSSLLLEGGESLQDSTAKLDMDQDLASPVPGPSEEEIPSQSTQEEPVPPSSAAVQATVGMPISTMVSRGPTAQDTTAPTGTVASRPTKVSRRPIVWNTSAMSGPSQVPSLSRGGPPGRLLRGRGLNKARRCRGKYK